MRQKSFWGRLFVLIVAMLVGIVVTYVIMILGCTIFGGSSLIDSAQQMSTSLTALRSMQVLQDVLVFLIPAWIVFAYRDCSVASSLFLSAGRGSLGKNILVACIGMMASLPLINLLVEWNESIRLPYWLCRLESWMRGLETAAQETAEMFLSGTSPMDLIMNLLIVALMAALSEEILFRGALLRMLGEAFTRRQTPSAAHISDAADISTAPEISNTAMHIAIWISAFIFSAFHMQFYGFFPRMLMGAWFGYMLWWTGSLWVPMAAHFTNNAVAVFLTFAANKGWVADSFGEEFGTGSQAWLSIVSVAALVLCTLYFRKVSKPRLP